MLSRQAPAVAAGSPREQRWVAGAVGWPTPDTPGARRGAAVERTARPACPKPADRCCLLLTRVGRLGVVIGEGNIAAQGQQPQRVLHLLALQGGTQQGQENQEVTRSLKMCTADALAEGVRPCHAERPKHGSPSGMDVRWHAELQAWFASAVPLRQEAAPHRAGIEVLLHLLPSRRCACLPLEEGGAEADGELSDVDAARHRRQEVPKLVDAHCTASAVAAVGKARV